MTTLAERYRQERKQSWSTVVECLQFIEAIDPNSKIKATDIGAVVMFSDGSQHRLGS